MFLVFNKQKIYTYLVTLSTVATLLIIATLITRQSGDLIQTMTKSNQVPIYGVKTDEKKIALTMNCAWSADDIDNILKSLEKTNTKITFFVVGDWADKYPEAVQKINKAGHEIGNHSNTHPHVNDLTYEQNIDEISKCSSKLKNLTGKDVKLYRAPYGEYNDTVLNSASAVNCKVIQWNVDTLDYKGLTGQEMWNRISGKINSGSIILTHNGTKHTADSLEDLINKIKSNGYDIVPVSELVYDTDYYIDSQGTQIKK